MGIQMMKAGVMPMEEMVDADALLKIATHRARSGMIERGGWPPLLFAAGTHEGKPVVMHADMYAAGAGSTNPQERAAAWKLAKEAIAAVSAHATCSTMEAWMSIFPKGEDAVRQSLPAIQEHWPEWAIKKYRREALVFTLETPSRQEIYQCIIERDAHGKPILGDVERQPSSATSGIQAGLLYVSASQSSPMN